MAVVEFDRKDFESLIEKNLKDSDYTEIIPMIGVTTESLNKDSVSFEVFPNRPDMLSVEGFTRALKPFFGVEKKQNYSVKKTAGDLKVDYSVKNVRPFIACAVIRNVKLTDSILKSLIQFQEKIHETFGRKREKVAIGIHDLSKMEFPVKYAAYKPGEISFVPLDLKEKLTLMEILQKHPKGMDYGKIIENSKLYPVITDKKNQVISFPPIINGELTRVTKDSKNLFVDVTGTSKHYIMKTLNMICASMIDRGATIESIQVHYTDNSELTPDLSDQTIKVNLDYLNEMLDTDLKENEIDNILSKMGVRFSKGIANVPCYRTDVMHQMDIVEDVAISIGYQNFQPRIPKISTMAERDAIEEKSSSIREIMIGLGLQEVVSFVLTNENRQFTMMNYGVEPCAKILNPKTEDYTICRKYVTPSLLEVFKSNLHNEYPQKIFEIGDCVELSNSETGTNVVRRLACAVSHKDADINEIKSIIETFMKLHGKNYSLKNSDVSYTILGRCGNVIVDKKTIGLIGEIDPAVLKNWGLENPVAIFEITIE